MEDAVSRDEDVLADCIFSFTLQKSFGLAMFADRGSRENCRGHSEVPRQESTEVHEEEDLGGALQHALSQSLG